MRFLLARGVGRFNCFEKRVKGYDEVYGLCRAYGKPQLASRCLSWEILNQEGEIDCLGHDEVSQRHVLARGNVCRRVSHYGFYRPESSRFARIAGQRALYPEIGPTEIPRKGHVYVARRTSRGVGLGRGSRGRKCDEGKAGNDCRSC